MIELTYMSEYLCGNSRIRLFKSQVVMLQAMTVFTADRLNPGYGYDSMDELQEGVRDYLKMRYTDKHSPEHVKVHKTVVNNLINNGLTESVDESRGDESYLSINIDHCLKSNISRVIRGTRPLPLYWRKAYLKSRGNPSIMCDRLAWILQYLEVYYHGTERLAAKSTVPAEYGGYTSYFEINSKAGDLLNREMNQLYKSCDMGFSPGRIMDFRDLAEVLLNIMIKSFYKGSSDRLKETIAHNETVWGKEDNTDHYHDISGRYMVTFRYNLSDNYDFIIDNYIN